MLQCVVCHQQVLQGFEQQEEEQEEEAEDDTGSVASNTSQIRIVNLWNTNERFRKDIKTYQASVRGLSKPKLAFIKVLRTKKREVAERYALLKAQYQGLAGTKKDEILQTQEYKTYKSACASHWRSANKLRTAYDIAFYDFRYLRHIRGLKSLNRPRYWCHRPDYAIRRALRLRL